MSWLPLYHDLGLVSGVLAPLVLGLSAVLVSPLHWVRDPGILLRAIHAYRGTACYMPNFALNHCATAVRDRDIDGVELGSLRQVVIGAEPVQPESLRLFTERFRAYGFRAFAQRAGYGMAEMVEGVTVTPARIAFAVTPVPCRASSMASCRMWDSRAALADDTTP